MKQTTNTYRARETIFQVIYENRSILSKFALNLLLLFKRQTSTTVFFCERMICIKANWLVSSVVSVVYMKQLGIFIYTHTPLLDEVPGHRRVTPSIENVLPKSTHPWHKKGSLHNRRFMSQARQTRHFARSAKRSAKFDIPLGILNVKTFQVKGALLLLVPTNQRKGKVGVALHL